MSTHDTRTRKEECRIGSISLHQSKGVTQTLCAAIHTVVGTVLIVLTVAVRLKERCGSLILRLCHLLGLLVYNSALPHVSLVAIILLSSCFHSRLGLGLAVGLGLNPNPESFGGGGSLALALSPASNEERLVCRLCCCRFQMFNAVVANLLISEDTWG